LDHTTFAADCHSCAVVRELHGLHEIRVRNGQLIDDEINVSVFV
jgi:hypothetical protein